MLSVNIFLLLALRISALEVYYVKPDAATPLDCPGKPCLTLDQYTEQADVYFTTGVTLVFLAGSHHLSSTVHIKDISDVTLRGKSAEGKTIVSIMGTNITSILCDNVDNLKISGLTFLSGNKRLQDSTIVHMSNSRVRLFNLTFAFLQATESPLISESSSITVTNCIFRGNSGEYGGAVLAYESVLTLSNNTFSDNRASFGGAIYLWNSSLIFEDASRNRFMKNAAIEQGGALHCSYSNIEMKNSSGLHFSKNIAPQGGAMALFYSKANLKGNNTFSNNSGTSTTIIPGGGALYLAQSYVTMNGNFIGNKAGNVGGAILSYDSFLSLGEHRFTENSCNGTGGAISSAYGTLQMIGRGLYTKNSALIEGGAIAMLQGSLSMSGRVTFTHNLSKEGGAVYLYKSLVTIRGACRFIKNHAGNIGGGIMSTNSKMTIEAEQLDFIDNSARVDGGAIHVNSGIQLQIVSTNFINNTAILDGYCGSALYTDDTKNASLQNITVVGNDPSALCFSKSSVILTRTTFVKNFGVAGGGVFATESSLFFTQYTIFESNTANLGGAITGLNSKIHFEGIISFYHNAALENGGAIYVRESTVTFNSDMVNLTLNRANFNGGAIYFSSAATMVLEPHTIITTSLNHAAEYGGAMFHEDIPSFTQCKFTGNRLGYLPQCFIQLEGITTAEMSYAIHSFNDWAKNGSFLYGGLLSRCSMKITNVSQDINEIDVQVIPYSILSQRVFHIVPTYNATPGITSKPYKLCFCASEAVYNCSGVLEKNMYRGHKFEVSLIAFAQGGVVTSATVTAKVSSSARLQLNQNSQTLSPSCERISYNLYATDQNEQMVLYPEGPCHDTGVASAVVNVTFLPCPDAFILRRELCICEKRLQQYDADCVIDDAIYIERKAGSRFWMSLYYLNDSYKGLILYQPCPFGYCTNDTVRVTLDNLDTQCGKNRSGVLCGACTANYSLVLGSSQCQICSNIYLSLLLPFAAAGIVLVVILTSLRLTVATGMVNSLILYANIVQAKKSTFLPFNARNVLTVGIAWMNLDLGFETCFYDGMDAYVTVWLQFAFPVYIWILVSLIIITSRYSITMTKLTGSNPISVLATLLLMSYTKILKIIIDVYSFASLEYPEGRTVTVWLRDANVPYLKSRHLLLAVMTSLVLVFAFIPYTLLLLLGPRLYRCSGRKYLRWVNRFKPLLDSYYAPYKIRTRYWTGLLLLVRCALYLVLSITDTKTSLLAVIVTFTAIGYLASGKIYTSLYANVIEASVYLNLVVLSAVTATETNSLKLAYALVGTVFATTICVIVYHFHLAYISRSAVWAKTSAAFRNLRTKVFTRTADAPAASLLLPNTAPHATHTLSTVTRTVISLREPALDDS